MKLAKRIKPGARKKTVSLNELQWGAVIYALDRVLDDEGGPLALLVIRGPYKKLFKQVLRAATNIRGQLREKRGAK